MLNDTEKTKVAGPSGPRISTGPAGRSLFSLTGPTVNILATGQRLRRPLTLAIILSSLGVVLRGIPDRGFSSTFPVACKCCRRRSITEWHLHLPCHGQKTKKLISMISKTLHRKLFFLFILFFFFNRNYGMGDTHVKTDVKTLKHQKSEYSLSVGKHSVTVSYNKRAISLS